MSEKSSVHLQKLMVDCERQTVLQPDGICERFPAHLRNFLVPFIVSFFQWSYFAEGFCLGSTLESFLWDLGALASPDRARTALKRCTMKNNAGFTKSRRNPCPGGLLCDHFPCVAHARPVLDRR